MPCTGPYWRRSCQVRASRPVFVGHVDGGDGETLRQRAVRGVAVAGRLKKDADRGGVVFDRGRAEVVDDREQQVGRTRANVEGGVILHTLATSN